jgi:hypothetical protein
MDFPPENNDLEFFLSRSVSVILKSEDENEFLHWFDLYSRVCARG